MGARIDFEKKVRTGLIDIAISHWKTAFDLHFDYFNKSVDDDDYIDVPSETISNKSSNQKTPEEKLLHKNARHFLRLIQYDPSKPINIESFRSIMIYGYGYPDKLDDNILKSYQKNILDIGLASTYYQYTIP